MPDEALSQLMNMGYKEKSAKRALRMTGLDMESAVEFLVEDRAKRIRRREEDRQRQAEILYIPSLCHLNSFSFFIILSYIY